MSSWFARRGAWFVCSCGELSAIASLAGVGQDIVDSMLEKVASGFYDDDLDNMITDLDEDVAEGSHSGVGGLLLVAGRGP